MEHPVPTAHLAHLELQVYQALAEPTEAQAQAGLTAHQEPQARVVLLVPTAALELPGKPELAEPMAQAVRQARAEPQERMEALVHLLALELPEHQVHPEPAEKTERAEPTGPAERQERVELLERMVHLAPAELAGHLERVGLTD
jgi:hypothetical protein